MYEVFCTAADASAYVCGDKRPVAEVNAIAESTAYAAASAVAQATAACYATGKGYIKVSGRSRAIAEAYGYAEAFAGMVSHLLNPCICPLYSSKGWSEGC